MDAGKLAMLLVTAVISVVMFSALLVPAIGSAQETAGDEVTLTNNSSIVLREAESGDVLKCTSTYDTDTDTYTNVWTLNDEAITGTSGGSTYWNVAVASDGIYMQMLGTGTSHMAVGYNMGDSTATGTYFLHATSDAASRSVTVTFGDSTITREYNNGTSTTSVEYDYTWAYVLCPYSDGEYCAAVSGGTGIVDSASDVILCGAYTSGELDTMYYYKDGTSYVSNSAYTMTPSITTEIHEGTTDIYDATVSVTVTDGTDSESFTPYRVIVPYEVTGHASSGSVYSMIGIVPLIVLVGIVLGAIGTFIARRD